MTLNDAILAATGGPTVNDGLRAYYSAQAGIPYGPLPDMERAFLRIQMPAAEGTNQDLWMQYLSGVWGYEGTLNDMLYQYWLEQATGFNPADMFTPTTPGWVYDRSDFSTLFQDSEGTTPVTAVEQPVGLVLDKSQGLVLGPELFTTFTTVEEGWVESPPGTWSINNTSGAVKDLRVDIFTLGKSYKIDFNSQVSGISAAWVGTPYLDSTVTLGNAPVDMIRAGATDTKLWIRAENNATVTLSGFSVKLLPGNHASQATTTKRPLLKVDGSGKYYLKGDGVDDFMSTAAIDFTGADSVTTWTGVQKIQDATRGILYELGTDTNTVNGTFGSNAPDTDGGTGFSFVSRGTSRATAVVSGYPAPYKAVLTAGGRISTDTCSMQVNLDSPVSTGADQGINAYISAPAYFGARAGTSLFFNGQSYSSVCLGRVATDEEVDNTREWVNDRTGAY